MPNASTMPRTRSAKATNAARLSALILEVRRRNDAQSGRNDLKRPRNLACDFAVERDIHRALRSDFDAGDRERANPTDAAADDYRPADDRAEQASSQVVAYAA